MWSNTGQKCLIFFHVLPRQTFCDVFFQILIYVQTWPQILKCKKHAGSGLMDNFSKAKHLQLLLFIYANFGP